MGDSKTVHVQQSGAQGTPGRLSWNAYGSAGYSLSRCSQQLVNTLLTDFLQVQETIT